MKTNNREILLYYHPQSSGDKKVVAHAQSLSKHIKAFDFEKAPSTTSSWQMIINSLDMHPKEMMDKSLAYYQENIRGKDFDEQGWVDIINRNRQLIKAPIAVRGGRAILCTNSTDILRLLKPNETDGRFMDKQ